MTFILRSSLDSLVTIFWHQTRLKQFTEKSLGSTYALGEVNCYWGFFFSNYQKFYSFDYRSLKELYAHTSKQYHNDLEIRWT